ncbi:MAG: sulfite exporter TauE/SafE family protein, partial [Zoogloea sp.]|uniref:sulfite exporter TauE/SafE family protein n=1 Tax=Zoogloea sp. TaxID=49181 RepID=UPI003F38ADD0
PRTGAALLWGGLSGFTSTLAHAGGPPVLIYLLNRRLDKETFIATTVVFFTVTNALKLVPYGVMGIFSPSSLLASLMLAPLAPLGVQLGMKLQKRIPERPFFWGATLLMGLSGLKLIFDGLA